LELFVVSDFINDSIYLILGFIIIQLIDNILLQPLIFSSSVKSHPLEIFLVIIFSGFLFGILGLIIAIPTYTFLKVIINNFIDFKKILSQ
jgi:predicted PurR-regulated permease PerM